MRSGVHFCNPSHIMLFSLIFTTVFLAINHIYSTFVSAIVSEGGAVAGKSLHLMHSLADYVPADQLCDQPAQRVRRVYAELG
jgi:hypothetical protein